MMMTNTYIVENVVFQQR